MNRPYTLMLIDDDSDDQIIFTSAISELDSEIECTCFDDAEHGLQVLQTNNKDKPDCIFLDLNLPFMHGFEFLKRLKTSEDLNNIPVIIYSTSSREADKVKAKELGAINFFSKPSSFSELQNKIKELLSDLMTAHN